MHKLLLTGILLTSFASADVLAAKDLKIQESIEIYARPSDVWDKVSNFGDLGAWHPAVKSTEIVEGKNNEKGAIRVVTLQDGGTIKEKLVAYNAAKHKYTYTILEGVLPVSNYQSTITVTSLAVDKAKVTWHGKFKSASASDEDAQKAISDVYKGGLENLKKIAEAR
jgi:mxaD protein